MCITGRWIIEQDNIGEELSGGEIEVIVISLLVQWMYTTNVGYVMFKREKCAKQYEQNERKKEE